MHLNFNEICCHFPFSPIENQTKMIYFSDPVDVCVPFIELLALALGEVHPPPLPVKVNGEP